MVDGILKAMKPSVGLFATLILLALSAPWCSARVAVEQVQAAIEKAKIFPPEAKISCKVSGEEIVTSAYKSESETENDCKIDAVLLAKTAFQCDPGLTRATLMLFDVRSPENYYEISVTVGDVAAFGGGAVSQERLLSSLRMLKKASTSSPAAKQPLSTPIRVGTAARRNSCSYYGVTLNYPTDWQVEAPRSGATLVRLFVPGAAGVPSLIEMQVYSAKDVTPANAVAADPRDTFETAREKVWLMGASEILRPTIISGQQAWHEEDARARQHFLNKGQVAAYQSWKYNRRNQWCKVIPVAVPAQIQIGPGQSVRAAQRANWVEETMLSARNYSQSVAFNSAGCTVLLGLFCPEANASAAAVQFKTLLSELKVAPGAAAAAAAKKPAK